MTEINSDFIKPRQAAMYIRMSTDNQKYSPENQAAAIREYAEKHKIEIIETFTDGGKSGLKIEGRDALKRMLSEVEVGIALFNTILVLDVTRWGRFQDADESAYYEYRCRSKGIEVRYVAEQFENDGSPVSTIVKGVKRAMAGEFSRELSGKVFAGQCRLIGLGFKQGGSAGYGLRRLMIDQHGNRKMELKYKERKSLVDDRVILIPGPQEEIDNVLWMYNAFIHEGLQESEIATMLNTRGIKTDLEREWNRATVHQVLTNEKYIGNNVFNRTSYKLKKRHVINDPEMWVRADGVFEAIVDATLFYTVREIIRERNRRFSNEELLDKLKSLHERRGLLSGMIIDETEDMPSSTVYQHRFGSLLRAYELIGYAPDKDYSYIEINRNLRKMHASIINDTIAEIARLEGIVRQDEDTDLLIINEELKISIIICRSEQKKSGFFRWKFHFDTSLMPDLTIAIRMDAKNEKPLDYYLLPSLDIEKPDIQFEEYNEFSIDAYRCEGLEGFYALTERERIAEAA